MNSNPFGLLLFKALDLKTSIATVKPKIYYLSKKLNSFFLTSITIRVNIQSHTICFVWSSTYIIFDIDM